MLSISKPHLFIFPISKPHNLYYFILFLCLFMSSVSPCEFVSCAVNPLDPKPLFLSLSHTDNASDPGVTAKKIWIDVVAVKDQQCLTFTDNGSGMTPSKLHKMLR